MTNTGPVPPLPAIDAPADLIAEARANCAARARARGEHMVAAAYENGIGDAGWGFRHEIAKLQAERDAMQVSHETAGGAGATE